MRGFVLYSPRLGGPFTWATLPDVTSIAGATSFPIIVQFPQKESLFPQNSQTCKHHSNWQQSSTRALSVGRDIPTVEATLSRALPEPPVKFSGSMSVRVPCRSLAASRSIGSRASHGGYPSAIFSQIAGRLLPVPARGRRELGIIKPFSDAFTRARMGETLGRFSLHSHRNTPHPARSLDYSTGVSRLYDPLWGRSLRSRP